MKFRFVGELDCPDWILAQITTLSKLSSIKFRIWCQTVMQHCIHGGDWPVDKLNKLRDKTLFEDATKFKGCLAAVNFILVSATKHQCSVDDLGTEMQQLGLPVEHSQQMCKVYESNRQALFEQLRIRSFKAPSFEVCAVYIQTMGAGNQAQVYPVVEIQLDDEKATKHKLAMTQDKLAVLKGELGTALQIAKQYEA